MLSPRTEVLRRAGRWLWPAALLALAPKCLLCVLAYAGLASALGFGGPEICGASTPSLFALAWLGGVAAIGWFALRTQLRNFHHRDAKSTEKNEVDRRR